MRPRRSVHPDAADPHRGEFVRRLLQEQVVEKRGRPQEGRADEKANDVKRERGGQRRGAHKINTVPGGCISWNEIVASKRTTTGGRRRYHDLTKWARRRQSFSDEAERN